MFNLCLTYAPDLHLHNFLLRLPNFDSLNSTQIYERFGKPFEIPIRRMDGKPTTPHAPLRVTHPLVWNMPSNELHSPEVIITDYGTSFIASQTASPTLHTPALYAPPEDFFKEPITLAADIWTLGVVLYEVLGERPLFETFAWDPDDILGEMVNVLGQPPERWWKAWANRHEFFNPDGSWISDFRRINTPEFRRLRQRMWDMGRGETIKSCEWDVKGGELNTLEDMLRAMMSFEPGERPSAEQLLALEYMAKWALPAWERQLKRES
jgi:serine/threonine protein kinase